MLSCLFNYVTGVLSAFQSWTGTSTGYWSLVVFAVIGFLSFATYLIPYVIDAALCEQNLRRKYGAEWAVVTGASSGIGRALTEKLASQGINVVMVALDDTIFADTFAYMEETYPRVEFRFVPADLGKDGYMDDIVESTKDISPNLIFNNAGFVVTGLFADSPLGLLRANMHCNAIAPLVITHHFANRLLNEKRRGLIAFTSSPAGLLPGPTTSIYSSSKAALTNLATSLAAELNPFGVDVLVVNPSPVDTGFYSGNKHDLGAMKFFQQTAVTPVRVASCFFKAAGRSVVFDQGYFPIVFKLLLKILDVGVMRTIIWKTTGGQADFKRIAKDRPLK